MIYYLRLIGLFGLVCLNLDALANKFIVESFKASPGDQTAKNEPRKDVRGRNCAVIKVKSEVEGLFFDADQLLVGDVVVKNGEYWIYVSPDEKVLRVMKDGFYSMEVNFKEFGVNVESNQVYVMQLKTETPEFQLGTLDIYSSPSGAEVTLAEDPKFSGLTPYHNDQQHVGLYHVRVKKTNYIVKDTVIRVGKDSLTSFRAVLSKEYGNLKLSVNPPMPVVTVLIDDQPLKPVPGKDTYSVFTGNHVVTFKAPNWVSEQRNITMRSGETDSLRVELQPVMGKVTIETLQGLNVKPEVWVNQKNTGYFAPGVIPLQIGENTLVLKKEGYPPYSKTLTLAKDENVTLRFDLRSLQQINKQLNSRKMKQNLWLASTAVFGAAGTYFIMESKQKYREYQVAVGPNADRLQAETEKFRKMGPVSLGIALFSAVEFTVQIFKKEKEKSWLRIGGEGQTVALTAQF